MTERDVQRQTVKVLRKLGYTVVVTSNRGPTANTKGCPDLFVWTGRKWVGLDTKQPGGKLSKEQIVLEMAGAVRYFTSVEQGLRIVTEAR